MTCVGSWGGFPFLASNNQQCATGRPKFSILSTLVRTGPQFAFCRYCHVRPFNPESLGPALLAGPGQQPLGLCCSKWPQASPRGVEWAETSQKQPKMTKGGARPLWSIPTGAQFARSDQWTADGPPWAKGHPMWGLLWPGWGCFAPVCQPRPV